MGEEYILIVFVVAIIGLMPIAALILSIIALTQARRVKTLSRRIDELEARWRAVAAAPAASPEILTAEVIAVDEPSVSEPGAPARVAPDSRSPIIEPVLSRPVEGGRPTGEVFAWETFLGQKALGWTAAVFLVLSAAFFLRYAYQNNWIGPIGRVAIGELAGAFLVLAGWRYVAGHRVLAPMLLSAGVVILYLATYSAFGFYHLLPQGHAGVFLTILIAESMLLAVLCKAPVVAWTALIGGLATPLLMHSERDTYPALFSYLAILNAGINLVIYLRSWPGLGAFSLVGTQTMFWAWYDTNYHPEKLPWALGFQAVLFALYLSQDLWRQLPHSRPAHAEDLARQVLNAVFWFVAFYQLNRERHAEWMGTAAVSMAALYTALARVTLASSARKNLSLLVNLAVATGFLAWAFPLQARAPWVAVGWAAMGLGLWWFGLQLRVIPLRVFALTLGTAAILRFFAKDLPQQGREPFIPILNEFALPALAVAACFILSAAVPAIVKRRPKGPEGVLVSLAALVGVLLIWFVLTVDCYGYFDQQADRFPELAGRARWLGQLSLSVLWSLYASVLLAIGFRFNIARLRWVAMGLFGITAVKVFLLDMANLDQIYRVLAFFILAVVLGLSAFAYQQFRPRPDADETGGNHD